MLNNFSPKSLIRNKPMGFIRFPLAFLMLPVSIILTVISKIVFGGILLLSLVISCSQQNPQSLRTPSLGIHTSNQGLNSGEYFITALEDTLVMTKDSIKCKIFKGEKIYFSDHQEERGIWEFKLAQPIRNCEITGWIYINRDHFSIEDSFLNPINDSIYTDTVPGQPDENEYESENGFGDYSGGSHSLEFFPLSRYPALNYKTGGREFGASRSNGARKHAANDLAESPGQGVFAVTKDKIIDYYYFYSGTYAIVVDHGSYLVRYGEVGSLSSTLSIGSSVSAGQEIGKVGQLYSGQSMLHFEKYTGKLTGNLTVRHNYPYQRRKDLVRPTEFLERLEGSYP